MNEISKLNDAPFVLSDMQTTGILRAARGTGRACELGAPQDGFGASCTGRLGLSAMGHETLGLVEDHTLSYLNLGLIPAAPVLFNWTVSYADDNDGQFAIGRRLRSVSVRFAQTLRKSPS